jgi:hypothetical protein
MNSCACGCGESAFYAARHVCVTIRQGITADDYAVIDCGFTSPCWIWKGRRKNAYANVRVRGTQMSVHRAMYLQEVGPIPKGAVIDHLCDEKVCLNPTHLAPTTIGENVRRSVAFHPTDDQLREIIEYARPDAELAAVCGISTRTIQMVRRRARRHQQPV